ncbi:MFS transporter [Fodinicola acaciae]|uniref:MFS transporter n=1 Tax=Fodinicola acaciae TaxID=2681555 RepID=UPI0013D78989|nr:MFS transporter [Fodinicola acaciae]
MSDASVEDLVTAKPSRRTALVGLCTTEITSWGVLFYAFPVLAPSITAQTHWPVSVVAAAFSAGLVVSALVGIPAGRWLDRHGPRGLMSAGSVLGVVAVVAIALAPTLPVFVAAWLLAGPAMAATFYPPSFAAVTRWYGPDRVKALTALTLVAGFASTVFAPLAAALDGWLGWRGAYLVLAVVLATVTIPIHLTVLRLPWPPAPRHDTDASPSVGAVVVSRGFVALLAAVTLGGFAMYAVVVNQVPLLIARGMDATMAAWALGLGGAGQVAGRLFYSPVLARVSAVPRTVAVLAAGVATTALLALVPGPPVVLVAVAILAGMARGLYTLVQATAISDRWGAAAYGRLNGILSAPVTIATAIAPGAGAVIATGVGGYPVLFGILAVVCTAGAIAATLTSPS